MRIRLTSYGEAEKEIRAVRGLVFGVEQQVPKDLEWDGRDPDCLHALATDDEGRPVGTGRLQADGKIGRLAVLSSWRGQGIGRAILDLLVESACDRGMRQVYLHAQVHALPFYEKAGFRVSGERFVEAGILHVNMTRELENHPGNHA